MCNADEQNNEHDPFHGRKPRPPTFTRRDLMLLSGMVSSTAVIVVLTNYIADFLLSEGGVDEVYFFLFN
jgi:hypothetical protein